MKTKLLASVVMMFAFTTSAIAQTGFAGNWSSDPKEVAAAESAARAALSAPLVVPPNAGSPVAIVQTRSLATLGGVKMDLAIAGNKVTGSIVLHDTLTMKITDGTVDGKVATLKSEHPGGNGSVMEDTWTAEMKDNDTFVVKVETHAAGTQPNPGGSNIVPVTLHRVK